jgi:cytochrome c oxidase subunit 1
VTTIARRGLLRRSIPATGFWTWVTTVDHKRIARLYGYTGFAFFIIGGLEALLLRMQLARPENAFVTPAEYNTLFTMHGTTMIFLVVMPIAAAFMNYLLPLMLGARDVAFPRMNALGYWLFLGGGVVLYSSFLLASAGPPLGGFLPSDISRLGSAANGGWFMYPPNSGAQFSPGTVIDFWLVGIALVGVGSLVSSVNLLTTIFNLRAKGMTLMRMPVFAWMSMVVNFLLLFSIPIITVAVFMLIFDRQFGTSFFEASGGGDPVLYQHLFWLFGHPEVYILILPAMGIVSEVLPVFSRKPLFGYAAVVFAGIAIGFLGFGVWAHHMFSSGIGPIAQAAFGLSTMTIAIPTGIKVFNWLATMWGGKLRFTAPMLFAIGFVGMFTIGGLSGVTHSVVPADWQQTDTYYVVAHFHYVLFGGAMFGIFAGLYYWFPKLTGRMYHERLAKYQFWLMFIGFNLTFGPMHWLGLIGMVRRTYTYSADAGLGFWNMVSTIGSFLIASSVLMFMANWIDSRRRGAPASIDPWDARTLEWSIPSPPPEYNFGVLPTVQSLDDFWYQKYTEDDRGKPVRRQGTDDLLNRLDEQHRNPEHRPHLPAPSAFPALAGLSALAFAFGLLYHASAVGLVLIAVGAVALLTSFISWAQEPLEEGAS